MRPGSPDALDGAARRTGPGAAGRWPAARRWIPPLALAVLTFLVYANALDGPFVFDDIPQIVQSADLDPAWPGLGPFLARPRAVTSLTFAWNHAAGGFEPRWYHLVNVVIHAVAGLFLFGIVRRTLCLERFAGRYQGVSIPFAWSVAALWLVHPLQTESVTYLVQRAESLMGLFYLAALYGVVRAATSPRPLPWQAFAVLTSALGMGCKPVMVTAPLALLAFDRVFLAESFFAVLRRRGWMHAGLACGWIVLAASGLFASLVDSAVVERSAAGFGLKGVSPGGYLLTQAGVLLHYLRLALWPQPLVLDYGWPIEGSLAHALPALLLVVSLLAAAIVGLVRGSAIGYLGAWFFLILAPTSSFVPLEDAAFEHRMYLPLAAMAVLVVAGACSLGRVAIERGLWSRSAAKRAALAGVGLAVLALGLRTRERNADYQDELVLWEGTVRDAPANGRAHNLLAQTLAQRGRLDEAIEVLRRGLAAMRARGTDLSDRVHRALTVNLVSSLIRTGRSEEAIALLGPALAELPRDVQMQRQLGLALAAQGRYEEAVAAYRRAIALDPNDPVSRDELALVQRDEGDHEGAHAGPSGVERARR